MKEVSSRGGVENIVRGSYTKAGNNFRINIMLQKVSTGELIGSERVEGTGEEGMFIMVDELTKRIKENFKLSTEEISSDFDKEVGKITTSSPEAYKYYILGLKSFAASDFSSAIRFYNMSLEIDSNFVSPLVHMTIAYYNRQQYDQAKEWFKKLNIRKDELSDIDILRLENQKALLEKDMNSGISGVKGGTIAISGAKARTVSVFLKKG